MEARQWSRYRRSNRRWVQVGTWTVSSGWDVENLGCLFNIQMDIFRKWVDMQVSNSGVSSCLQIGVMVQVSVKTTRCVCVCVRENMCQVRRKFQNNYSKKYLHYAGVEAVGTDKCQIFLELEGSWYLTVARLHGVNTLDSQFQAISMTWRGSQSSWRINHWLSQASMSHKRQEGEDKKDWTRKWPGE